MKHGNVAVFVPHAGCPHQCAFCNQKRISGTLTPPRGEDVQRLLQQAVDAMRKHRPQQAQIAFFGGSFTAVPRAYMLELLDAAQPFLAEFSGIRISTRPDAVDDEILAMLRRKGVTAIELGAQSMREEVLLRCGRGHTAQDTRDAAARILDHGFVLGLQMMTGLPGDDDAGALSTARQLLALGPQEMRVYPTLVLRDTPLAEAYTAGQYRPQTLDEAVALGARLLQQIEAAGVRVLRMGLHDDHLAESVLAGPYHPAFRALCESRLYYENACRAMAAAGGRIHTLIVHPKGVSSLIGQRRENLLALERRNAGSLRIRTDAALLKYAVRVQPAERGETAPEIEKSKF